MLLLRSRNVLRLLFCGVALSLAFGNLSAGYGAEASTAGEEFFEKEIRPLLAAHCLQCHGGAAGGGVAKTEGGLSLTSRAALLHGGDDGPAIVPGRANESLLIRSVRHEGDFSMPPKKEPQLTTAEIAALARWVDEGAAWPASAATIAPPPGQPYTITPEQRKFWSFQPVRVVPPPTVKDAVWPHGDIDRFLLAAMEMHGLKPSPPADKRTLLRRVTFDLTGLPPTPEEIAAFLRDDSAEAFRRVVNRLLESPAYGQRWGRHWLDTVRYADSRDSRAHPDDDFNEAWRYRDWVVDAFNHDMPYDQFIVQQFAGDLSPATSNGDGVIATEMLSIGRWDTGEADKEKMMTDIVDDQIDLVGRTFLGLTLACARCHDHKFDPIPTADYYGLAGIFFSSHVVPDPGDKTKDTLRLHIPLAPAAEVEKYTRHAKQIADLEQLIQTKGKQPELLAAVEALKATLPPPPAMANGALEGGVPQSAYAGIHDAHILIRGSYARLGEIVPRHFPTILTRPGQPPPVLHGSGRLELARWIASPDNPTTARVMVNRIWQHHFGQGIVRTPDNFGKLGKPPTHPELLDYLADQFVASGWSIKAMHRAILLSAAYQQSSAATPESLELDRENLYLSRMNRRRLEAEPLRDALLFVTGELDERLGGPATLDFNSPRRTLYQLICRSNRSTFRELFDAADSSSIVSTRTISTVAPQALFMLNDPFVLQRAKNLATRVNSAATQAAARDDAQKIDTLYELLFARLATPAEREIGVAAIHASGWEAYCQVLLCSNEFMYID
jgi:mono/diheme cytochrome c family protein